MSPQYHSHTWHLPSALETGRTLEKNAATPIPQGEGCSSGAFCEGCVDLRQTHGSFSKDRFIQDQQGIAFQGLQPWHVSLPHGKGRRALLRWEGCWQGSSRQNPRLFLFYCPVTKSCPTLCYPMDSSMPGFPVLHSPRVCSDSCQ